MNLVFTFLHHFSPFLVLQISGDSMYPTLRNKDKIISLHKLFAHLKKNDICICQDPKTKRLLVKRIKEIKNNTYFVEGDNKKESTDSRHFGWLDKRYLVGKVIFPRNK